MDNLRITLGDVSADGRDDPVYIVRDGIRGFYDLPALKSDFVARPGANGAWPTRPEYSARTVTLTLNHEEFTRADQLALHARLNSYHDQAQRLRVEDAGQDSFVTGVVETVFPSWVWDRVFQVVVTCADPHRYSTVEQSVTLAAGSRRGAFEYPVVYPVRYGAQGGDSAGSVSNRGNATAFPVIEVAGNLPGGFTLTDSRGRSIRFSEAVYAGTPVRVDCRNRVVTRLGVNVSTHLTARQWFDVAPGGDLTVSFEPASDVPEGQAWAEISIRDTWI